jgi:hypothetical protein
MNKEILLKKQLSEISDFFIYLQFEEKRIILIFFFSKITLDKGVNVNLSRKKVNSEPN